MTAGPRARVLYRDARLIALDKPSGLLVHRGWDDDPRVALDLAREAAGAYVYPVHRLDRGTSGVLLFALDAVSAAALQRQFASGRVRKRYVALVRGNPPARATIDHPIPRAEDGERVDAVTEIQRVAACGRYALVLAYPRTGRLHQIRRHLKHISCPVIGDANYGKGAHNRALRDAVGLARLALHASELACDDPRDESLRISILAPLPDDLRTPLVKLGFEPAVLDALDRPGMPAAPSSANGGEEVAGP